MELPKLEEMVQMSEELQSRLRQRFGEAKYELGEIHQNLPRVMNGPGEPRWSAYAFVLRKDSCDVAVVGIYRQHMSTAGSDDAEFYPLASLATPLIKENPISK
mgnify:CR=1 FL=1